MLSIYVAVDFSVLILVFRCSLKELLFYIIFTECFQLLVSQKNNVCVCVPGFNMLLHKCCL